MDIPFPLRTPVRATDKAPLKGICSILLVVLVSAFTVEAAHAQTPTPAISPDQVLPYDEAEAYAIAGLIMCPVCPAETIDQAQVPIARQMRQMVRGMLAQGATREEILDFFVERYGQDILASPPKSGFNLVAWIFPLVGVSAALAAGVLVLRSMSSRSASKAPQPVIGPRVDQDLQPYLEMVDQQLDLGTSPKAGDTVENTGEDRSDSLVGDVKPQREGKPENDG